MKKIRLWKNKSEISDLYATVDDEDYEKVMQAILPRSKWYAHAPPGATHYAIRGEWALPSMHRLIMGNPKGMCVDHINGDTLDNRKENLRICTMSQNSMNKKLRNDSESGFKGVYEIKKPQKHKYVSKKTGEVTSHYHMPKKRFRAYIADPDTPAKRKRVIRLGYHATAEEAAMAYDKKALEIHGEFARLNFPEKLEEYRKEVK